MSSKTTSKRLISVGFLICWTVYLVIKDFFIYINTTEGIWIFTVQIPIDYPRFATFALIFLDFTIYLLMNGIYAKRKQLHFNVFFMIKSYFLQYDLKRILLIVALGIVSMNVANSSFLMIIIPFLAAGSYMSKETWLKPLLFVLLARLLIQLLFFTCGLAEDNIRVFDYGVCHSYGFGNPNTLGFLLFFIFMLIWIIYGIKTKLLCVLSCLLSIVIFLTSGCRTAAVLSLALPLLDLVSRKEISRTKWFAVLFVALPFLCVVVTFVLGYVCYAFEDKFGGNFACRFIEAITLYQEFGISFFARDLPIAKPSFYLDNAYVYILYHQGLLYLIIILGLWTCMNYKIWKSAERKMITVSIVLLGYLQMENLTELSLVIMLCGYLVQRREPQALLREASIEITE